MSTMADIQNTRCKKLVTHVESHASAVSLLESGEQRYIKAVICKFSFIHSCNQMKCEDGNICTFHMFSCRLASSDRFPFKPLTVN